MKMMLMVTLLLVHWRELITCIQNGDDIRIYFRMGRPDQPNVFVEHTALVKFTTILNSSKGKFVTAQIDPIVGQVPNFEKRSCTSQRESRMESNRIFKWQ